MNVEQAFGRCAFCSQTRAYHCDQPVEACECGKRHHTYQAGPLEYEMGKLREIRAEQVAELARLREDNARLERVLHGAVDDLANHGQTTLSRSVAKRLAATLFKEHP